MLRRPPYADLVHEIAGIHSEYTIKFIESAGSLIFAGGTQESAETSESITIIDAAGREVTIEQPVDRIVFTHHMVEEHIATIGAWEKVFELQPDVIITLAGCGDPELEELINKLEPDIPVVLIDAANPQKSIEIMNLLGTVLGKEERANEFSAYWNKYETIISEKLATLTDEQKPRVFTLCQSTDLKMSEQCPT